MDRLVQDERFREEFEADRAHVLHNFSLSQEQRKDLMSLDVRGLVLAATAAKRRCPPVAIV